MQAWKAIAEYSYRGRMKRNIISGVIRDFLTFNRSEQRGIIMLILIFIIAILVNKYLPEWMPQHEVPDFSSFKQEIKQNLRPANQSNPVMAVSPMDTMVRKSREPTFRIDINLADSFDFQRLPGIGPAFSRRIIAYRTRLGGFVNIAQIREVYGMDLSRYHSIEPYLILSHDSVRTIPINSASLKEMLRHPYFTFEVAKEVMIYRRKIKQFNAAEQLMEVPGMLDSTYRKILPYVRFDPPDH
jgi:DNA uptake protein ComE-like DNA-binding protein